MGDIYSKAERVLAWLGPAYDNSDKAMDLFPRLVDHLQTLDLEKKMEKGNHKNRINDPIPGEALPLPELERKNQQPLYKLFSRPYFSRVWTLHELALGNNTVIVCGDPQFPFAVLERFKEGCDADSSGYWAFALNTLSESDNNDLKNPCRPSNTHFLVACILKGLDSSAFALSSATVLSLLRTLECSKSDDRVYSILRFLPPTLAQNLAVVKEKSTEALFIDLAAFELTQNRSMDFLAAAGMFQHRRFYPSRRHDQSRPMLRLPTWVPDWTYWTVSVGLWAMSDERIRAGYGPLYQAADSSRGDARLTVFNDTKILCVQGKIIDDIAACVKPFDFLIASQNQKDDGTYLKPVQDMTETQMMEHSGSFQLNSKAENSISYIEELKLQADSCMALAKSCKMYDDDIERTTACRQTLIGGMVTRENQSTGGGVQVKATNEEANQLFTEWENLVETNELLKRTEEVIGRLLNPQGSDMNEEDMLFLSRAQEMTERMDNRKWSHGFAMLALKLVGHGRRFFTTTKGFVGLAPDIAQVGDKVCLISGCCTPFIIRADGPNFCLVGESYVHGVMDGELMSDIVFEDINLV